MAPFWRLKVQNRLSLQLNASIDEPKMYFKAIRMLYELVRFPFELIFLILYTLLIWLRLPFTFLCNLRQKSLKNEIILVTGSAGGIGRATCLRLAKLEKSISLVCWDICTKANESLAKELEKMGVRRAIAMSVDVTKEVDVQAAYKQVCNEVGNVTMIINNAGINDIPKPLWEMNTARAEKMIAVNLTSHFYILRTIMPDMVARGKGHIVTTCSIAGFAWAAGNGPYVASKFGVRGYLECLREDIRYHAKEADIKVTTVYPSLTRTNIMGWMVDFKMRYSFMKIPWMTPEFVAKAIVTGIRKNQEHVFIPGHIKFAASLFSLLPAATIRMANNLFGAEQIVVRDESLGTGTGGVEQVIIYK